MRKTKKKAILMMSLLAIFLLLALLGKYLAPNDPYATNLADALLAPSGKYPFGTDNLGRCILSRVLAGASASVYSALAVVAVVFVIGTLIGIIAGYAGGVADQILMKVTMIFQAFPSFILAVAVAGMLGPGVKNAIISLMFVYWTTYARLARSLVLQMKDDNYIRAAKLCGARMHHILLRHVFPNILAPMLITATLDIGNVVLSMAGLSFLGLGVQAPVAEWGLMINNGRAYLQTAPWCILFPSVALFLSVMLFNFTGDCVRDAIDAGGDK